MSEDHAAPAAWPGLRLRDSIRARFPEAAAALEPAFPPRVPQDTESEFRMHDRSAEVRAVDGPACAVTLRQHGFVALAHTCPDLGDTADLAGAWLVGGASVRALAARFPAARWDGCAEALDDGFDAYRACRWDALRREIAADPERQAVLPLYDAARAHPVLGRLVPVGTMGRFGLQGSGTAPPGVGIGPSRRVPGGYEAALQAASVLREVDAHGAIRLLLEHAPRDVPPAT